MSSNYTINVAKDFSDEPYGRYPEDGDSNGTKFLHEFLLPSLEKYTTVTIVLDKAEGYGSSFLDESFGGLVRDHGYNSDELIKRLIFISEDDPSLIQEIQDYILHPRSKKK